MYDTLIYQRINSSSYLDLLALGGALQPWLLGWAFFIHRCWLP